MDSTEVQSNEAESRRPSGLQVVESCGAAIRSERRRLDRFGNRVPPSVTVVIPALNEERNLPRVLQQLPSSVGEVVVVDGGSRDRTVEVTQEVAPRAIIIGQTGQGKGDALRNGFAVSHGDAIVMLDADGSMSPGEIPRFIDTLRSGGEFVKGSRFLPTAGSDDLSALRRIGNHGLLVVFNKLYDTGYTDLCYGYAAFWRRCLPFLDFDIDGFEVEAVLNIRSLQAGLDVREVPSFELRRQHGNSRLRIVRDGWDILRLILSMRRAQSDEAVVFSLEKHARHATPSSASSPVEGPMAQLG